MEAKQGPLKIWLKESAEKPSGNNRARDVKGNFLQFFFYD